MNKTITINLSGVVFHIDEQAYEKLKNYLNTIRGYFKNTEGGDDIISDIEARIAELFQQKMGPNKQALLIMDVDSVIETMGRPESFAEGLESDTKTNSSDEPINYSGKRRRIFRDEDDKVIGGVCSGFGHYFGFDPIWMRLIFAIVFFAGFGTGFLIYLLLLIIIPKAKTAAEKLEMKGEPITVSNIEKTVREEMDSIKSRMKDIPNEFNNAGKGVGGFVNKSVSAIGQIAKSAAYIIVKILGGILIFIGVVLLIAFCGMFFGSDAILNITADGITHFSLPTMLDLVFVSSGQLDITKIGLALLIGIPLLMVIFSGTKMIFKIQGKFRALKLISLSLWTIGLIICIITAIQISKDYSQTKKLTTTVGIIKTPNNVPLIISMNPAPEEFTKDNDDEENKSLIVSKDDNVLIAMNDDELILGNPILNIEPSNNDSMFLEIHRIARGSSKKEASNRANNISYEFGQKDSALNFNSYFKTPIADKWRAQRIKATLYVPIGQTIFLDNSIEKLIWDIDNVTDTWDGDMLNRRWVMTNNGLTCVDCNGIKDKKRNGRKDKDEEEY